MDKYTRSRTVRFALKLILSLTNIFLSSCFNVLELIETTIFILFRVFIVVYLFVVFFNVLLCMFSLVTNINIIITDCCGDAF